MYKKITRDIQEEHYGAAMISPNPGVLPPLPSAVINERTLVFRMDSRTHWTRYSLGMINYSVSRLGNLSSTPAVERNLSRNANFIGDFFVPYYGITSGTKIGNLLNVITLNGVKVVEALVDKKDIEVYQTIWDKQIYEWADYLNQQNPSYYPRDLLAEMMTNLTVFWVEDFQARIDSDFAADSVALDNILKVAVTGIPNHVNRGYSSIADILSRGIVAQFPLSFTE